MIDLREAAMMALEALEYENSWHLPRNEKPYVSTLEAITALCAALAQQDEPQTLDEAMQQPHAMAQAYESGYKAGVANEREACAKVCDFHVARLSAIDEPRPALAVGICAAAIRARGNT